MIRVITACLLALAVALPLQAKNKNVSDAIVDVIRDEIDYDDKHKGKGRPDNPGEHGRKNAHQKQCENPGKGSKCDNHWEDSNRDAKDRDYKDNKENKTKNKKGDKNR